MDYMDKEILDKIIKAGRIAAQVRDEGAKKFVVGASCLQVMDFCEKRILELGGKIAWAQMAINDVAAHYCPAEDDETALNSGDLVKIDVGVHIDGWIADTAMTVEVRDSNESKDLIKTAQNALSAAIRIAKPGTQLWELGEAQMSEAESMGLTTIRNLSGHTLGRYKTHGGISIPTFNNKDKTELQEGWQIAIEPFITDGDGLVKDKGKATIFMVEKEKNARTPYARKILDMVKPQNGLPFTLRWLTRSMGKGAAALGLKELEKLDIIKAYPPLAEITGRKVAQWEHSIIVKDKPTVYTKIE